MTSLQTARLLLPRPNHQTHGCWGVRRLLIYTYYIAWGIHRHCHWIFSASWHSLIQQYVVSFGQALCLIRLPSISTPSDPTREQKVSSTKLLCLRISLINCQQNDISTILLIHSAYPFLPNPQIQNLQPNIHQTSSHHTQIHSYFKKINHTET